ncbi:hypothetical protein MJL22_28910, partial [Salmonella enterica subsp. enterica serovar Montevideo]|nr:hypothetical protein [Salmonella enterica subsp. enterica serovar Montevideo]
LFTYCRTFTAFSLRLRIKKATCFYFGKIFICITRRQGADGYILFAILFNGQKTNWLIVPGLLIALTGVCWVLGGENGLNPGEI